LLADRRRSGGPACKHLSGIEDPGGVEQVLDTAHERQEVAVLALQVVDLAEADAVFAGTRSAAGASASSTIVA
jgi:hypothetical protein